MNVSRSISCSNKFIYNAWSWSLSVTTKLTLDHFNVNSFVLFLMCVCVCYIFCFSFSSTPHSFCTTIFLLHIWLVNPLHYSGRHQICCEIYGLHLQCFVTKTLHPSWGLFQNNCMEFGRNVRKKSVNGHQTLCERSFKKNDYSLSLCCIQVNVTSVDVQKPHESYITELSEWFITF